LAIEVKHESNQESAMRSNRHRLNLVAFFIAVAVLAFFAWSIQKAFAEMPNPTGTADAQAQQTANIYVTYNFGPHGPIDIVSMEWDGQQWTDCDRYCAGVLQEGNDRQEQGFWWLHLRRNQRLVRAQYQYRGLGKNVGRHKDDDSWNGTGLLYATIREPYTGLSRPVPLHLLAVSFSVYSTKLPSAKGGGCDPTGKLCTPMK
jgi:hypothetical protein